MTLSQRFAVTKSRKLVIALILLVGGYGSALLLGSFADLVFPGGSSPGGARSDGRGLLATLKGFVPHGDASSAGQLVPESEFAANASARSNTQPPRRNDRPTWLAASPIATSALPVASSPAFAPGPTLTDSRPPEPAPVAPNYSADLMPNPVARITNVVGASGESVGSTSPWDRWPRWEPSAATPRSGAVSAGLQAMEPVKPRASQAAYDSSDYRGTRHHDVDSAGADSTPGRTHVVVDGDSLAKLADRYLDDPALDDEIFRLNRDVLTDPEMLPIGVELRIPDGRTADSTTGFPAARSFETAQPRVPSGMVPVEWTPRSFDDAPRAQLLRPIPAGRSD